VAGDQKQAVGGKVVHDMLHIVVVARVSLLKAVPDWRFIEVFLGKLSFLVHVSSSNELDAEVVAEDLGGSYLEPHNLFHSLEVLLVAIHNDVLVSTVVLVSKLLTEGLDGRLHESLLCIDVEHAVSLTSKVCNCLYLIRKLFKNL